MEFGPSVKYKVIGAEDRQEPEHDKRDRKDDGDKDRHDGKDPKPPKGHIEVLFHSHGKAYVIQSNDLDLLGVSEETPAGKECHGRAPKCVGRADMRWTASLADATKPHKPITLATNLALQVTVTDAGGHGSGDTIAITLWNGNALMFSSAWTGAQTVEQALKTGKITVD